MAATPFVPYRSNRSAGTPTAPAPERAVPRLLRERAARPAAEAPKGLECRLATPDDVRWILTWAASLGVPAPRSAHTRSYVFLKDGQRVGYEAVRHEVLDGQPYYWIASTFIIPAYQRQGLALQFLAMTSQRYYQKGKVGCRVAIDNTRVIRMLRDAGFQKMRQTNAWVDLVLELTAPWTPTR